jgi:hypothetical protein
MHANISIFDMRINMRKHVNEYFFKFIKAVYTLVESGWIDFFIRYCCFHTMT